MEASRYDEMIQNLDDLGAKGALIGRAVYLFGHCDATEALAEALLEREVEVAAILDNNPSKQGRSFRGIRVTAPQEILEAKKKQSAVCIAARAYAAMADQMRRFGYDGPIYKVVDYNSFAEYSLSEETILRMRERVERGLKGLEAFKASYPGRFRLLCPFPALGDIYFMMSYLPAFLERCGRRDCAIGVVGRACGQVVRLFGEFAVEFFSQRQMDEMIQAALYTQDRDTFIPHQDRPYVVNLYKVLYSKRITLEKMYCCGVFGLPFDTLPANPSHFQAYDGLDEIPKGKAVILSPYAKSVTGIPAQVWEQVVTRCEEKGLRCYTNVAGEERPLPRTEEIRPTISEVRSVVERAGYFIGIRSGLCDVLCGAKARKIALYPDYNYSDTRWKSIDIYYLNGWENLQV